MRNAMESKSSSFGAFGHSLIRLWGVVGVAGILGNGARRVLPVAMEPLRSKTSRPGSFWIGYIGFSLGMAYAEGYLGFHRKFSPNVVARSMMLRTKHARVRDRVFAPLFCMELIGTSWDRLKRAWSFSFAVVLVVGGVKRLPPDGRAIVDAGVCTGLSVGILSVFYHYLNNVLRGVVPPVDGEHTSSSDQLLPFSFCPVTLLTNSFNGLFAVVSRNRSDKTDWSDGSKTCPLSGKNGTHCPIACRTDEECSQPVAAADENSKATAAVPDKQTDFMKGKSLVASIQKKPESRSSLLMKLCPLNWNLGSIGAPGTAVDAAVDSKLKRC